MATSPLGRMLEDRCTRCDMTLRSALFAAAMIDFGAISSINPHQCDLPDGTMADHDFQPAAIAKATTP